MSRKQPPLPILDERVSIIDSHCHLDMDDYREDLDQVIGRAIHGGVRGIVTIGIDPSSSRSAVSLAKRYTCIRATVGIHPHDAETATETALTEVFDLASENQEEVVGYGEIGLDYVKKYADPKVQRKVFRIQLRLARELKLPIIIHDREAHDDCLRIIKEEGPFDYGGIMHCFSGNLKFAHEVIDCNFHVSIPGIVTYNKADEMREVARHLPIDRLLVETDGPFLAPVPYRGKRNEPLYTLYTVARIAELRNISTEELARHTTANACALFNYTFGC